MHLLPQAWSSLLTHLQRQHQQQCQAQGQAAAPGVWQEWPSGHLLADQLLSEVRLEPAFDEAVGRCLALLGSDTAEQHLLKCARQGAALGSMLGNGIMLAQVLVAGGSASSELLLQHR